MVEEEKEEKERRQVRPNIFYACRTHSQLAQFVSRVVKLLAMDHSLELVSLASTQQSEECVPD